jgi:hypothetical protein
MSVSDDVVRLVSAGVPVHIVVESECSGLCGIMRSKITT